MEDSMSHVHQTHLLSVCLIVCLNLAGPMGQRPRAARTHAQRAPAARLMYCVSIPHRAHFFVVELKVDRLIERLVQQRG